MTAATSSPEARVAPVAAVERLSHTVARNSAAGMGAAGHQAPLVRLLGRRRAPAGAEAFGEYAAVLAFGALFVALADLGLAPTPSARWRAGATRSTSRAHGRPSSTTSCACASSCGFLAAVLLVGTAWLTGRPPVMVGAIALGAIGLLIYGVHGASEAVLSERLDLVAGAKVAYQLAFVLLGACALWLGAGYHGLILANLAGIALMTWLCWRAVRRLGVRRGRRRPALAGPGARQRPLRRHRPHPGALLQVRQRPAERLRGTPRRATTAPPTTWCSPPAVLSNVLNTALYPSLSRQAATAPTSCPAIYERALRYLMILSLPIACGAWALAGPLVAFLFSAAYLPAVPALQIVIWPP